MAGYVYLPCRQWITFNKKTDAMKVSIWLVCLFFAVSSTALLAQDDNNFGKVSYYSDSFQGNKTASGELYDKNKLTAAHKTLPFGTVVKVTRLDNKRSVQVRVNDRGPFIKGRIIELSRRAAEQIGLIQDGIANVKIEIVGKGTPEPSEPVVSAPQPVITPENIPDAYDNDSERIATDDTSANESKSRSSSSNTSTQSRGAQSSSTTSTSTGSSSSRSSSSASRTTSSTAKARLVREDYQTYDLYKINLLRPEKRGYGVQVASLTQYENVLKQVADLQAKWFDDILLSVERGPLNKPIYKIILGSFDSMAAAENYKENLKSKHNINGFVVDLTGEGEN